MDDTKTFRILSIDGGGIRGIYPAHILKRIKDEFNISFYKEFDIISGTSTGSIIASALALDIPIETICSLYETSSKSIFKKNKFSFFGIKKSLYSNTYFISMLEQIFGNSKMKDTKTRLIIPSTDLINGGVYIHKTPYNPEFLRDGDTLIRAAILSSSSAPLYFDPAKTLNGRSERFLLADGGLWANNPSLLSLIESLNPNRLNCDISNIKVLSIGTGTQKTSYSFDIKNWGFKNWGRKLIDFTFNLQSQNSHNMLSLLLNEDQYLRINFSSEEKLPLDHYKEEFKTIAANDFYHNSKKLEQFFKGDNKSETN